MFLNILEDNGLTNAAEVDILRTNLTYTDTDKYGFGRRSRREL